MEKNIYVLKEKKSDGTIIYEKINIDISKFDIVDNDDNQIIVKPKPLIIKIVKLEDFDKNSINFRKSKILSCYINDKRPLNNKYFSILKNVYEIIGKGKIITKNTLFNFETIEKNDNGFKYLKNIGISIQAKDAVNTFEEILNQCVKTKIKLEIEIKFESGNIIKYLVE